MTTLGANKRKGHIQLYFEDNNMQMHPLGTATKQKKETKTFLRRKDIQKSMTFGIIK